MSVVRVIVHHMWLRCWRPYYWRKCPVNHWWIDLTIKRLMHHIWRIVVRIPTKFFSAKLFILCDTFLRPNGKINLKSILCLILVIQHRYKIRYRSIYTKLCLVLSVSTNKLNVTSMRLAHLIGTYQNRRSSTKLNSNWTWVT